jgi:UDP-N-acetylmuramoylalanine--D-glutamate ligase
VTLRALIYGIGIAGEALATAMQRRGYDLVLADDMIVGTANAAAANDDKRRVAERLGVTLIEHPQEEVLHDLVASVDILCPAPGVPETHPVILAALHVGRPIRTEIDLAYEWEQRRVGGPRPMLAITGTDGKTTTTLLTAAMLAAAGHRPAAVGNTEVPLVAMLDSDVDVFAVECSSFRLNWLDHFRAEASVWLNLAPDHQNWHTSFDAYAAAKARMWQNLRSTDVAIGFAADPVVMGYLDALDGPTRTFGTGEADYRLDGDRLVGPQGVIAHTGDMRRALPHDITNALAAAALVLESGLADTSAVRDALRTFTHPPHRIEPLGELHGVRWYNDSKATSPHAALTAIRSFTSIVLLAGGRNKGLDLASLATEHVRIKAVVALGESAPELVAAFEGHCPVDVATTMHDAVAQAAGRAAPGDTVLLSPACASFDWYPGGGYPARGDDFKAEFALLAEKETA